MKREQSSLKIRPMHSGKKDGYFLFFIDHIMMIPQVVYSCYGIIIINSQNIIGMYG